MKTRFLALVAAAAAAPALAADHRDAPLVRADALTDINDVYAFQSPANPANTVLVLTVNPFADAMNPTAFSTSATYAIHIDNNSDATPDVSYTATFGSTGGPQTFSLARNGAQVASGQVGATSAVAGGGVVSAGVFDDPFFFDLNGFNNGFAFTGDNFFAGANTSAIVLELPSSVFGAQNIGVYATTSNAGGQIDRKGRPAINTALIASSRKDAFNAGSPADDVANFGAEVEAAITSLSNAGNAAALTPILLPDLLTIDTASPAGFLNGRALADDVIDAELGLLTAGALATDGAGNDSAFLNVFPYLAAANVAVPEPASVLCAAAALVGAAVRRR